MKHFDVGDRVERNGSPGEVIANNLKDFKFVAVQFDNGDVEKVLKDDLEVEKNPLEKEFQEINDKLMQANQLLSDAAQMATKHNKQLSARDNKYQPLFPAFEEVQDTISNNSNWSSSSANC